VQGVGAVAAGTDAVARLRAHRAAIYASGKVSTADGGFMDAFPTGLTEGAGEFLRDAMLRELAGRSEGGRTIEVGMALGLSTLFIVEALLLLGRGGGGSGGAWRHVAVDPYQREHWRDSGVRSVEEAGAADLVTLIRRDSLLELPRLVEGVENGTEAPFEFGFVDGGHHFENAFIDTYYMHRLVRPGGLIIVDDVWMPGVSLAVSYFEKNLGSRREEVGDARAAKRFAVLRTAEKRVERAWDHFVEFC